MVATSSTPIRFSSVLLIHRDHTLAVFSSSFRHSKPGSQKTTHCLGNWVSPTQVVGKWPHCNILDIGQQIRRSHHPLVEIKCRILEYEVAVDNRCAGIWRIDGVTISPRYPHKDSMYNEENRMELEFIALASYRTQWMYSDFIEILMDIKAILRAPSQRQVEKKTHSRR